MRIRSLLQATALCAALSVSIAATAQQFAYDWNPRSGDAWVDGMLGDINAYGERYRDSFIDEMARYHGAPRDLVSDLLLERRWAPGDVYMACGIAGIVGQPCRNVVDEWDRDHGQGWGAVARRLGIKPGSPEFHRLKRGFVPTYDRWARPIRLDAQLQRDFPGRGKGDHGNGKDRVHGKGNGKRH